MNFAHQLPGNPLQIEQKSISEPRKNGIKITQRCLIAFQLLVTPNLIRNNHINLP